MRSLQEIPAHPLNNPIMLWNLSNYILSSDVFILVEFIKITMTKFHVVLCFESLNFLRSPILRAFTLDSSNKSQI